MDLAILEAIKASWHGQIPVGAILVKDNKILFQGHNTSKFQHVEMLVVDFAFRNYLTEFDLYLTQEPCIMCWFALHQTFMKRLFFGAYNRDYGGLSLNIKWKQKKSIEIFSGIHQEKNLLLLKSFFYHKRLK